MGAGFSKVCVTCRKDYYLGYCSYSGLAERERRFPHADHEGHELANYNEDYTHLEGNDLMLEGHFNSELYIKDLALFEKIDLSVNP